MLENFRLRRTLRGRPASVPCIVDSILLCAQNDCLARDPTRSSKTKSKVKKKIVYQKNDRKNHPKRGFLK